ncbi:hydrophobin [Mycena amicta]|nr:hydrophobin [Mycena amicta]
MFSKLSVFLAFIALAVATTIPVTPPTSDQCCSSVVQSDSIDATKVLSGLGINLGGVVVPVGLSCSPITVVGENCGGVSVTCDPPEVEFAGLIAINCIPITA